MPKHPRKLTAVAAVAVVAGLYATQAGAAPLAAKDERVKHCPPESAPRAPAATAPPPTAPADPRDAAGTAQAAEPAEASASLGLVEPQALAELDLDSGQQPEGVVVEPDGSVVATFSQARQIARIHQDGTVRVLATLPAPPPHAETPAVGEPFLGGIARADDGALHVVYATGTAELTGVWRLPPGGGTPRRTTPLPADSLPNGLAVDARARQLYVTDSVGGAVWRAPLAGGRAVKWNDHPSLAPSDEEYFLGANGIRIHDGSVWVTNHDRGTVLRFPRTGTGTGAAPETVVEGLGEIDDLEFVGRGDAFLVTGVTDSRVVLVRNDGRSVDAVDVLTEDDGLQNPTALARHGSTVHVASSAAYTLTDPNVLSARLTG
ncbi:SMP-30/gluconolactonase/LRE family protein [Streptomyces sp. NPDC003860]